LTVNVCPAIVADPLRGFAVFGAIVNTTLPLPVPLAPVFTVMNDALLTAVHVHVAALVPTLTVIVTPPPFALALVEPRAKAHVGAGGVVTVVVVDGVVVVLLEHAPASIAAANPIPAAAAENVRWVLRIGRIF
jgi:hypothetical protein